MGEPTLEGQQLVRSARGAFCSLGISNFPTRPISQAWSTGILRLKKGRQREQQYLNVERHRPVVRVERVTCDALIVGGSAAAADLPQAGYSRTTCKVSTHRARIPLKFLIGHRARSNNAHV